MQPLIDLDSITYAYPLPRGGMRPALRGISLRINAGEYVAIVGANGSGKSTLALHLNALLRPDGGSVHVAGLDTRDVAHLGEIRRTVGMVFQRPEDQIVATVIEEDVAFGPENLALEPATIRARVREALEWVGLWDERRRPPHQLSAGQQQRVALAGALAMRPRCLVFDEASAMLDPAGRRTVRDLLARLHREGLTIITITHFMEEALDAERVIVLDRGRVALDGPPAAVFADAEALEALNLALPPAARLARRLRSCLPALPAGLLAVPDLVEALDALPRTDPADSPSVVPAAGDRPLIFIEVHDLGHVYMQGTPLAQQALKGAELAVAEGTTHGLLGATGSGKSTLMQHLNGLLRPQEGTVRVGPYDLAASRLDVREVRRMVGLAFQQPETQIFEQYVGDEIAFGPRQWGLHGDDLREQVRWAMELVGLDFEGFKDRLTFTLSGGERRKVALASVLALRPRVLLLDEPTAGLDPLSRRELLAHLAGLRAAGLTMVLSSHQMEDLAKLAGHLTVLDAGATVLDGHTERVFAQAARLRALGLDLPVVAQVAEGLQERGWALPPGITSPAALCRQLGDRVRGWQSQEEWDD